MIIRVGDRVGDIGTVTRVIRAQTRHGVADRYVLTGPSGTPVRRPLRDLIDHEVVPGEARRPPDKLDPTKEITEGLKTIEGRAPMQLARAFAERAARSGCSVLLTGGILRDAASGGSVENKDVDLTGDVPTDQAAEWLEGLVQVAGLGLEGFNVRVSGNGIVHVMIDRKPSLIQYAPTRGDYAKSDQWCQGVSLDEDLRFRDVRMNTISYDLQTGVLVGVDLDKALDDAVFKRLVLMKLPPVNESPWDWPFKAVARALKAVVREYDRNDKSFSWDTEAVEQWFQERDLEERFTWAIGQSGGRQSFAGHMAPTFPEPRNDFYRDLSTAIGVPESLRRHIRRHLSDEFDNVMLGGSGVLARRITEATDGTAGVDELLVDTNDWRPVVHLKAGTTRAVHLDGDHGTMDVAAVDLGDTSWALFDSRGIPIAQ